MWPLRNPYPLFGESMPQESEPQRPRKVVHRSGLPMSTHLMYAFLGWIPCGLGWIIWPIHWWFARKKTVTYE